jgi:tRNA G18 (ribose-2'-O)-methylase SpoU
MTGGTRRPRELWAEQRRLARRQRRLEQYRRGLREFAVAACDISKDHNVGSLVRTAHAAAAEEVLLTGTRDWNRYAARTAELYTRVAHLPGTVELLAYLHERGYHPVAVELDPRAVPLFEAEYPERPCFVLGAELGGLGPEVLDAAELIVQIPQWGLVPSLNLAVAGSIVIYDHLGKLHRAGRLDRPAGGLSPEEEG